MLRRCMKRKGNLYKKNFIKLDNTAKSFSYEADNIFSFIFSKYDFINT